MDVPVIDAVRLTSFKSFRDAVLPLDALTLLVGRNGSGKSNALDGLWVLSRLAHGEDIRDAIDGGRDGPAVRGGVIGCAPFGESSFSLGCTVRTGDERVDLDLTILTEPVVQVYWERLRIDEVTVLESASANVDSGDIEVWWKDGRPGPNPHLSFRASRLLTAQAISRIPSTPAGARIHRAAASVLESLRSIFVLDPVSHQMRQYVPRRDVVLRRNAENLSAAAATLLEQPASKNTLRLALSALNEQHVADIEVVSSVLDDVMLRLVEGSGPEPHRVPLRLMSDGSLRFLAILVALMQAPTLEATRGGNGSEQAPGQTTLVIEEVENGLHASQAATLVQAIRDQVNRRRIRALVTAHSPALLDALTGDEHRSVIVCERDADGLSTLSRLVDLPGYFNIAASGTLGRAAVTDRLSSQVPGQASARSFAGDLFP